MADQDAIVTALNVIGEALSLEPDDFQDHETWKFLGLGELLASATAKDLTNALEFPVEADDFLRYPNVGAFKKFVAAGGEPADLENGIPKIEISSPRSPLETAEPADPWDGVPKPKVPLSVVLQGKPSNTGRTVFLLPDGSGAGTSYGTLPPIGDDVCLIGLNSPFLRQAQDFTCSIERMARLWLSEIRKLQPKGSYILGGWSAGGYYSYEITKLLVAAGEKVERLILIDSPCRLVYEALPAQVVDELTTNGLMGASGAKRAPEWLVQHFTSTVLSVDKYMPTPLAAPDVPANVDFIWVREGLVKDVATSGLKVDLGVKVTRFLLEPRGMLKTEGWEKLLPGTKYGFDYMTGNHFQITQTPHVETLGKALRKILIV
ncbi:hypothetical protein B0A48_17665 [Cryoendolithus antarcticus]|uniref:Thioesterase domain-containing protein n=1 Tax=Cryoendolithus antarcticus TaxID=1507870 RepID=A0A1V8SBG9_9PEZI|nr:hypothetical protein B0A48_17665 [Cryoendolithus antarcticus]